MNWPVQQRKWGLYYIVIVEGLKFGQTEDIKDYIHQCNSNEHSKTLLHATLMLEPAINNYKLTNHTCFVLHYPLHVLSSSVAASGRSRGSESSKLRKIVKTGPKPAKRKGLFFLLPLLCLTQSIMEVQVNTNKTFVICVLL